MTRGRRRAGSRGIGWPALLLVPAAALAGTGGAAAPRLFAEANLRFEAFEDGRFASAAQALTLSARGGIEVALGPRLRFLVEGEGAAVLGGEFDDGRGRAQASPRIPDPPNAEINRLALHAEPAPGWSLEVGRQYVTDFRQRYFGRSGWRQSRQSFDAARLRIVAGSGFGLELAHLARVWRPAGRLHPDPSERSQRLDTWLLVGELEIPGGRLEGFVHEIGGRGDARVLAHRNRGLRWRSAETVAPFDRIDLLLEAARQRQRGRTEWLSYRAAELGLERRGLRLLLGVEYEGGNGERAFQTPFGSGHAFNGWADRFSATPPDGLLDRFAALMGRHRLGNGGEWILRRHDFRATRGGRRYGSEWNAELTFALRPGLLRLKFADHRGASPEEHLAKLWLSYEISAGGGR